MKVLEITRNDQMKNKNRRNHLQSMIEMMVLQWFGCAFRIGQERQPKQIIAAEIFANHLPNIFKPNYVKTRQ